MFSARQGFISKEQEIIKFVANADRATIVSSDGINWRYIRSSIIPSQTKSLVYARGIWVGCSFFTQGSGSTIYRSYNNGNTWTSSLQEASSNSYTGITYGNSLFVACSYGGRVATSPDAVTWTQRTLSPFSIRLGITYANNIFVVVGNSGSITTSNNGITWTQRTSPTTRALYGITYANNLFVAVGSNGTIVTSPDGITWTQRTSPTTNRLNNVTYGNNLFVAIGINGTIVTSPDGITWTQRTSPNPDEIYNIIYAENKFFATLDSYMLISSDGISWSIFTPLGSGVSIGFIGAIAYKP